MAQHYHLSADLSPAHMRHCYSCRRLIGLSLQAGLCSASARLLRTPFHEYIFDALAQAEGLWEPTSFRRYLSFCEIGFLFLPCLRQKSFVPSLAAT